MTGCNLLCQKEGHIIIVATKVAVQSHGGGHNCELCLHTGDRDPSQTWVRRENKRVYDENLGSLVKILGSEEAPHTHKAPHSSREVVVQLSSVWVSAKKEVTHLCQRPGGLAASQAASRKIG